MDRGLDVVRETLTKVKIYVQDLQAVDRTLRPNDATTGEEREAQFILRRQEWECSTDPMHQHFATMMRSFEPGLFVGGESADFPADNVDLERWFKRPKGHERRIHGRRHAGVRIVGGVSIELVDLTLLREFQGMHETHQLNWYTTRYAL